MQRPSIRSPSRSFATSSKASPTRCSSRCCRAPSRRSSRKARRLRGASSRRRRDPRAGVRDPDPSRDPDPRARKTMIAKYPLATMREGDVYILNDPYLRRHAPARHRRFHRRCSRRARRSRFSAATTHHQDVGGMSPGSHPDQRDRDLPGRPAHSRRSSTWSAGRVNETLVADPALEHPAPRHVHGRPQCAARRPAPSARGAWRARRRTTAREHLAAHLRGAARALRDDDARRAGASCPQAPTATSTISTTTASISTSAMRIEVAATVSDGSDPLRLHRHRPAAARAVQLRALGRAVPRPISRCARSPTPQIPDQRRLLSPGHAAPARRHARQPRGAGAGQRAHGDDQAHLRLHGERACRSRARARAARPRPASR